MRKKEDNGNVLLIVTLLIMATMLVALAMLEKGVMQYKLAQVVKQTTNTDLLVETTVLQCKEGVNHLIKTRTSSIIKDADVKDKDLLDEDIWTAHVLKETVDVLESYYFKSHIAWPIDMHYQVKSDRGVEDRTATVYTRLYLGDSIGYIPSNETVIKDEVKRIITKTENERLIRLIKRSLVGKLSKGEMNDLLKLKQKMWQECHFIIETIVEVKDKRGYVFDREKMIAGVRINIEDSEISANISWIQAIE